MQSEPCTCRIQTVRRGQVVRIVQQATGVQLLNVEQECLLLEADVKHYSEVQNLFSLLLQVRFSKASLGSQ